jgi:hypothetical protein
MELMQGDLRYHKDVAVATIDGIVQQLHNQLRCLSKILIHGQPLYYTDLTAANVLYRDVSGKLTVRLGDLGSAGVFDGEYRSTHPFWYTGRPWETVREFQWIKPDDAANCVVYQLAHLICRLHSGTTISMCDGHLSTLSGNVQREEREDCARTLRTAFPGKPYAAWLLLEKSAVEEFWREPVARKWVYTYYDRNGEEVVNGGPSISHCEPRQK